MSMFIYCGFWGSQIAWLRKIAWVLHVPKFLRVPNFVPAKNFARLKRLARSKCLNMAEVFHVQRFAPDKPTQLQTTISILIRFLTG